MEIWTNGLFPATRHRVVVPAEETLLRTHRQSFVLFSHPEDDVTVEPIHGEAPKSDKYKPINARKHLIQQFLATYQTFVPT